MGGRSSEHEVSLNSARSVIDGLDPDRYEVVPIEIPREGAWHLAAEEAAGLDVVFPVLHGPFGEDGAVQGVLELAGVAYVGAGVTASGALHGQGSLQVGHARQGDPGGAQPDRPHG